MSSPQADAPVGQMEAGIEPKRTRIHVYQAKSNFFRVVHADGVWGGVSPHGNIQATFFSERKAIPRELELEEIAGAPGILEVPESRVGKEGNVRELEVDIVMDLSTARAVATWLTEKIATLERLLGEAATQRVTPVTEPAGKAH